MHVSSHLPALAGLILINFTASTLALPPNPRDASSQCIKQPQAITAPTISQATSQAQTGGAIPPALSAAMLASWVSSVRAMGLPTTAMMTSAHTGPATSSASAVHVGQTLTAGGIVTIYATSAASVAAATSRVQSSTPAQSSVAVPSSVQSSAPAQSSMAAAYHVQSTAAAQSSGASAQDYSAAAIDSTGKSSWTVGYPDAKVTACYYSPPGQCYLNYHKRTTWEDHGVLLMFDNNCNKIAEDWWVQIDQYGHGNTYSFNPAPANFPSTFVIIPGDSQQLNMHVGRKSYTVDAGKTPASYETAWTGTWLPVPPPSYFLSQAAGDGTYNSWLMPFDCKPEGLKS